MHLLAPAKINLHLRVGLAQVDGFHPIVSWMCTIGLFDSLEVRRAGGEGTALTIERADVPTDGRVLAAGVDPVAGAGQPIARASNMGKMLAVPADGTNLIVRAASLWVTDATGPGQGSSAGRGLSIVLRKQIPVGGGLGGGSSDAARTLFALNQIDRQGLSRDQLARLGAQLGSDVPFFFHGPSSICRGRGEKVSPTSQPRARWAMLFLPETSLSTAHVYQRFDAMNAGQNNPDPLEPDWAAWADLPARQLMEKLVNDLEAPAFDLCPELGQLRGKLAQGVGQVVRMSGSGSSLFTLFDEEVEAKASLERIRKIWNGRIEVVALCPPETE
jgi:4-diphosphocytidyl-2-C-methyl-D-erythritol kinase